MNAQVTNLVEPPIHLPEIQRGIWCALPSPDAVASHLATSFWDRPEPAASWEVARLSGAVYLYRERATQWAIAAKFYTVKTGDAAERHAHHEFNCTQQARLAGLDGSDMRALRPLGLWRGVLFLEYMDGLTLEDVIAVRRSRPGTLVPSLERAAELLALLHTRGLRPEMPPDFESPLAYARKLISNLVQYGVLADNPVVSDGLARQVNRWAGKPAMRDFVPALNHGDATTTNFVFPWDGGIVAIDWERSKAADPAADLGRLMAEVLHSITQHGGSVAEATPDVQRLRDAYCRALPADWDADVVAKRAHFYQASSTLRIARNGWLSRLDRTALVAQALALLADG